MILIDLRCSFPEHATPKSGHEQEQEHEQESAL